MGKAEGPTFIGVGAQKAASTWLAEILNRHPDIYMPRKEIHYFDYHYARGRDWYVDQFSSAPHSAVAIGEFTPMYMYDEQASERLIKQFPQVRLLCILRDPVARAFSQFKFSKHKFNYPGSFEQFFFECEDAIGRSLYYHQLCRYSNYIESGGLLVLISELATRNPDATYQALAEYLNVDAAGFKDVKKRGSSKVARFPKLRALVQQTGTELRRKNMHKVADLGIKYAMPILNAVLDKEENTDEIPRDLYRQLGENFSGDILKLEKLIQRDLTFWPSHPDYRYYS